MASAAKRAGTKMMEVLACVCSTASYIVLKTGMPSTSVPPLPGEVPPTTFVPYSFIFGMKKPVSTGDTLYNQTGGFIY